MATETTHTPGALRAAKAAIDALAAVGLCSAKIGDTATQRRGHYEDVAAIIDRETAAPDLYAVLVERLRIIDTPRKLWADMTDKERVAVHAEDQANVEAMRTALSVARGE